MCMHASGNYRLVPYVALQNNAKQCIYYCNIPISASVLCHLEVCGGAPPSSKYPIFGGDVVAFKGGAPVGAEGAMTPPSPKDGESRGGRQPIDKKFDKTYRLIEPHEKFVGCYAVVGTTGTL